MINVKNNREQKSQVYFPKIARKNRTNKIFSQKSTTINYMILYSGNMTEVITILGKIT